MKFEYPIFGFEWSNIKLPYDKYLQPFADSIWSNTYVFVIKFEIIYIF